MYVCQCFLTFIKVKEIFFVKNICDNVFYYSIRTSYYNYFMVTWFIVNYVKSIDPWVYILYVCMYCFFAGTYKMIFLPVDNEYMTCKYTGMFCIIFILFIQLQDLYSTYVCIFIRMYKIIQHNCIMYVQYSIYNVCIRYVL
jgi:hypothetical protein